MEHIDLYDVFVSAIINCESSYHYYFRILIICYVKYYV